MSPISPAQRYALKWSDLAIVLVLLGIILRIILLIVNQGLSEAESHLAINFVRRSLNDILLPLDHGQVAPPLFLIIEKLSVMAFGQNEFAVRWLPCSCSCLALIFFYRFLKAHTNIWIVIFGVAMMALNRSLIMTAVSAKQYSSDLLICIILFSIVLNPKAPLVRKYLMLAVIGSVALWFSHVSVFILFSIGVYSLFDFKGSLTRVRLAIFFSWGLWVTSFAALYLLTIARHPNTTIMVNYWNEHFMPLLPSKASDLLWFYNHFRDMISYALGFSSKHFILWIPYAICFVAGVAYCWRNKQHRFLLWTLLPMAVHLLLSGLKIYPFSARLILYLEFPILTFIACGMYAIVNELIIRLLPEKISFAGWAAGMIVVLLAVGLIDFPYPMEDIKKSLSVVRDNFKAGDQIYVYYPVDAAFEFYQQQYIPNGATVVYGKESRMDPERYIDQLSLLDGRVWLVFSHLYTNPTTKITEDVYIVDKLEARGKIISTSNSFAASVYLMDLYSAAR